LTVEVQNPEGPLFKVTLVLTGDRLKGDVVATRQDGQTMNGTMDVGRIK
jgi:hypothetical protein